MESRVKDEWVQFCLLLQYVNRYHLNTEQERIVDLLINTAHERSDTLDRSLFRARLGLKEIVKNKQNGTVTVEYVPIPCGEMGIPPYSLNTEGRINPRGISYLYLSKDWKTAVAELRPWPEAELTVGTFVLKSEIKVLDVSKRMQAPRSDDEEKLRTYLIWKHVDRSFSIPYSKNEVPDNYVVTQYLAERFKKAGFTGIVYSSSVMPKGKNVALFNSADAACTKSYKCSVGKVKYELFGGPYV